MTVIQNQPAPDLMFSLLCALDVRGDHDPEDGGSTFFRNFSKYLPVDTT
jgi:hypothetical protein